MYGVGGWRACMARAAAAAARCLLAPSVSDPRTRTPVSLLPHNLTFCSLRSVCSPSYLHLLRPCSLLLYDPSSSYSSLPSLPLLIVVRGSPVEQGGLPAHFPTLGHADADAAFRPANHREVLLPAVVSRSCFAVAGSLAGHTVFHHHQQQQQPNPARSVLRSLPTTASTSSFSGKPPKSRCE